MKVGENVSAELLECVSVEVRPREVAVAVEFFLVRELEVSDLEVVGRVLVDAHRASGERTERAPCDERLDRPGKVVVEADECDVWRGIRVVDRMDLSVLDDHFG